MVDLNVIAEKLKQLSLRIAKVQALCPPDLEALLSLSLSGGLIDVSSFP
jgi:hypothetical protein